jgi:hypothetical protein
MADGRPKMCLKCCFLPVSKKVPLFPKLFPNPNNEIRTK